MILSLIAFIYCNINANLNEVDHIYILMIGKRLDRIKTKKQQISISLKKIINTYSNNNKKIKPFMDKYNW